MRRSREPSRHPAHETVQADVYDLDAAIRAAQGASVVYHCLNAPYHQWPTQLPLLYRHIAAAAKSTKACLVVLDNVYAIGATRLYQLVFRDPENLLAHLRTTVTSLRLFEALPQKPVITLSGIVRKLDETKPPASKALGILVDAGIPVESAGKRRDRTYRFKKYLDILAEGIDL